MKQESYETCVKPEGFWNDVRIRDRCAAILRCDALLM